MGGPHGRSSSTTRRPSSATSPKRRGARRSNTADKGASKKDASRLLKATLAEEEKKQLAAWLDKKHKEVDAKLKKLGVPSPMKLDSRSSKGPEKGEQGPSADDDIMMILGKRMGKGARPVHTHRTEFLLDEEGGGGGGFDDESEAWTSPSRPPTYAGRGVAEDQEAEAEADGVPLAARLAAAAKRHQYSARQVLELFFPLWDDHKHTQHDTKALLPLEQVLDVLAVDLGLKLSRSEQRVLAREADKDKGARVDVGRLLQEAGLWCIGEGEGEGTQGEWAASADRGRTHWAAAARREAGPRPDSDRARARLQQRRHDAAVHIQRMVRGRLARKQTSSLRFDKMTSRHQAVRDGKSRPASATSARRRRSDEKAVDREKADREKAEREGLASHRAPPSAWGEVRGHEKGREGRGKGPGQGAVSEEDLDVLFEQAFGGEYEAFSRTEKGPGKGEGAVRGGTLVELLPEPTSPPRRREEPERREKGDKGKQGKGAKEEPPPTKEDRLRDLFEREDWSGVSAPYGEALMAAVGRGGDGAFYRLAALLRGMQMGTGEGTAAFLPYSRIRAAFKEAGYTLGEPEASHFLLGVGCDKHGLLDVAEVLQALADLRHELTLSLSRPASPTQPKSPKRPKRPAGYQWSSQLVYPDGASASPGRRSTMGPPRGPILGPAEKAVLAQMRKGRHEGRRRMSGAQLLAPFLQLDPFQDGFVGLMEFASCLDTLGLTLGNDDIAELAFKYRCPEGVVEEEGGSGMGVDYAPFVRFIVDAMGGRRRRGRGGEDGSGSEADEEGSEEEDEGEEEEEEEEEEEGSGRRRGGRRREEEDFGYGRKTSKRSGGRGHGEEERGFLTDHDHMAAHADTIRSLQDLFYASGDKRRTLKTLRLCLTKADASGSGTVDRALLAKALKQAGVALGDKDLSDLSAFLGDSSSAGGGDGAYRLAYPRLLRVWESVLDCPKESAHGLMTKLLDGVGRGAGVRLRWVRRLRRLLTHADKYRGGVLEAAQLVKLMQADGSGEGGRLPPHLSTNRLSELASAFVTEDRDGVAYRPLLRSLAQHAGRWYELDPDMATRLLTPFPRLSPPPRFLCALRRTLREMDHSCEGRIDGDDVDFALRNKARLGLSDKESAALLDALNVDGSGSVAYEELLAFFHLYTLPWHEMVEDVAQALAQQLFFSNLPNVDAQGAHGNGWRRFSALRAHLHDRDRSRTGTVSAKALKEALKEAQLTLRGEDFLRLVEALEVVVANPAQKGGEVEVGAGGGGGEGPTAASSSSSSLVRYRALLQHLLEYHGEAREEVVDAFISSVRRHLAEHQGGVRQGLAAILQGCVHDDADKSGRVSIECFRRALQRCGVRVGLEEVGRLADVCDAHGDGRIDYRSILDQVSAGQASASSTRRPSNSNGQKRKRQRPRDWTWARSPPFLCLRAALSRLPPAARDKSVKKAFAEFDRQEEGSVSVEDMEEVLSGLASLALPGSGGSNGSQGNAVSVSQAELRELCLLLYGQSMGHSGPSGGRRCIAYDEVVRALILGDREFDARFPAPLHRTPGSETRLLYERVLQQKRNVVVGHRTPKDGGGSRGGGAGEEGEEGKFLTACRLIDRKKTGLISVMDVRKVATQLGLKPKAPLTLKALIDNNTVGGARVKFERFLDEYLGRPSHANNRRGSTSSSTPSPKIAKLLSALEGVKEDSVPHGLLARLLRRGGFEGSTQEVMALTKGLAGASGRSVKKALLLTHIREHGAERLLPQRSEKGAGEGEESEEGEEEGRTALRGAAGKKAVAFAAKKRVSAF